MSEQDKVDDIYTQEEINPLAKRLFAEMSKGKKADIIPLAKEFIAGPAEFGDIQERGLLAYLFLSSFDEQLPDEASERLVELIDQARSRPGVVADLLVKIQILRQEVKGYFQHQSYPFDYCEPAPLESPLATSILLLECHRAAASQRREFQAGNLPNMVVQAYVNPYTSVPGVWMSVKNIAYDANKLSKGPND